MDAIYTCVLILKLSISAIVFLDKLSRYTCAGIHCNKFAAKHKTSTSESRMKIFLEKGKHKEDTRLLLYVEIIRQLLFGPLWWTVFVST